MCHGDLAFAAVGPLKDFVEQVKERRGIRSGLLGLRFALGCRARVYRFTILADRLGVTDDVIAVKVLDRQASDADFARIATELRALHALFEDRYFGELIFLVKEGVLIVPSHMGERPIRAMHGYHPTDKHSYVSFLTNQPSVPDDLTAIPHIGRLMHAEARLAKERNQLAAK